MSRDDPRILSPAVAEAQVAWYRRCANEPGLSDEQGLRNVINQACEVIEALAARVAELAWALEYAMSYPDDPDYFATDEDRANWTRVHAIREKWSNRGTPTN